MSATFESLQHGKYRINDRVAHNSRSAVYDAHDNQNNVKVTLKEISAKLDRSLASLDFSAVNLAFSNQASQLTGLSHPGITRLYDHFTESGSSFLVYESFEGRSLANILQDRGEILLADILNWADKILEVMVFLHYNMPPVVHRNIQPSSIYVTPDGAVKLSDFGLSHFEFAGSSTYSDLEISYFPLELLWNNLDPASQKVIAQSYSERSEQILKQPIDGRSDLYSLGACLFHLLSGQKPINALERSIEMIEGKPDPLTQIKKGFEKIPTDITQVVLKALSLKREERFDSAIIMRQALKTAGVKIREDQGYDALHISINPGENKENVLKDPNLPLEASSSVEAVSQKALEPNTADENLRIKREQLLAAADERRSQLFRDTEITREQKKEEAKNAALEAEAKRQAMIKSIIETNKSEAEAKQQELIKTIIDENRTKAPVNPTEESLKVDLVTETPQVEVLDTSSFDSVKRHVPEEILPTGDEFETAFENIFDVHAEQADDFSAPIQEIVVEGPANEMAANEFETSAPEIVPDQAVDHEHRSEDVVAYSEALPLETGLATANNSENDSFLIGSDYVASSSNKWLVPGVAGVFLLVIAVVAAYVMFGGSTAQPENAAQQASEEQQPAAQIEPVQESALVEEQTLTTEPTPTVEDQVQLPEDPAATTAAASTTTRTQPARPLEQPNRAGQTNRQPTTQPLATEAASRPPVPVPAKPAPATKPTTAPKKLTVDDLINDN